MSALDKLVTDIECSVLHGAKFYPPSQSDARSLTRELTALRSRLARAEKLASVIETTKITLVDHATVIALVEAPAEIRGLEPIHKALAEFRSDAT